MTIIPIISKPDTAIRIKDGHYYAAYHIRKPGGRLDQRLKRLHTADITEARRLRDEFFAGLLMEEGVRVADKGGRPVPPLEVFGVLLKHWPKDMRVIVSAYGTSGAAAALRMSEYRFRRLPTVEIKDSERKLALSKLTTPFWRPAVGRFKDYVKKP